jgi:gas vesicle structural protein
MAIATQPAPTSYLARSPNPSGLADVLNIILDKGLVVDIYVRVSLVGIELLTIDARIVIASVDTYLRFAEAVNRLDLVDTGNQKTLPGLIDDMQESGASKRTKGVLEGAKEKLFGEDDDDKDDEKDGSQRRTRQRSRSSSGSRSGGNAKRSSSRS